jgi:hypothetical protein
MNPREFLAKQKTHLFFIGALLSVLAFNIATHFTADQTFLGVTWSAISEIRIMDYLLFGLVWYACATHRFKDDWHSSLITLNLGGSNNQK